MPNGIKVLAFTYQCAAHAFPPEGAVSSYLRVAGNTSPSVCHGPTVETKVFSC